MTQTQREWAAGMQGRYWCQCGCGEPIEVRPAHKREGVPRFRLGHNPQPRKPRTARTLCECGCGDYAKVGRRYINGHNSYGRRLSADARERIAASKRGAKNPRYGVRPNNYKGWTEINGYKAVRMADHPFSHRRGYVFEHRLKVEQRLRETDPGSEFLVVVDGESYLSPGADVHHINHVKQDNRSENLIPIWRADHARAHGHLAKVERRDECPKGHPYDKHGEVRADGRRQCSLCKKAQSRRGALRRKADRWAEMLGYS